MKSGTELVNKLLTICGDSGTTYGYSDSKTVTFNRLSEEQRKNIELELIGTFKFSKVEWMHLPITLTNKNETVKAKSILITDSLPVHEGKVGYIYSISFTPAIYKPDEIYNPIKEGCTFSPMLYDAETGKRMQSITLTRPCDFFENNDMRYTISKQERQLLHDMLDKVLDDPEVFKPKGNVGCIIRYTVI